MEGNQNTLSVISPDTATLVSSVYPAASPGLLEDVKFLELVQKYLLMCEAETEIVEQIQSYTNKDFIVSLNGVKLLSQIKGLNSNDEVLGYVNNKKEQQAEAIFESPEICQLLLPVNGWLPLIFRHKLPPPFSAEFSLVAFLFKPMSKLMGLKFLQTKEPVSFKKLQDIRDTINEAESDELAETNGGKRNLPAVAYSNFPYSLGFVEMSNNNNGGLF